MPIRPSQRARYPKDWPAISLSIRRERAGGRCECRGECGHTHGLAVDYCDDSAHDCRGCAGLGTGDCGAVVIPARCTARNGAPHPVTGNRVVLTVAHLDHNPEHCEPDNLRAMCQRCHLAYDAELHRRTATATRRARRGTEDLFDGVNDPNLEA